MKWLKRLLGSPGTAKVESQETPLHEWARGAYPEEVRKLLAQGADVHARNKEGDTPLRLTPSPEVAALLLAHGADINTRNNAGMTPMHRAAFFSHTYTHLIDLYLEHGAEVDPVSNDGMTPLLVAVLHHNKYQIVQLLEHGADPDITDKRGRSPFRETFLDGGEIACLMIAMRRKGGSEKDSGKQGVEEDVSNVTLHQVALDGNLEKVQKLLSIGRDVNEKDSDGCTPLHKALGRSHVDHQRYLKVIIVLLENGADVSIKDNMGRHALHWAHYAKNDEAANIIAQMRGMTRIS